MAARPGASVQQARDSAEATRDGNAGMLLSARREARSLFNPMAAIFERS
jgi:hypothetical protein